MAKNRAQSAQKSIEALKWQTSHREFRGMQNEASYMIYVENLPSFIDIGSSSLVSYQNFRINQHVLEICFCHAWLLGALSFRHSVPSPFAHADLCPSSFLKKSSMKKRLNGLAFLGFGFDSNPLATATYH